MKKTSLILLLSASIIFAYDTSNTKLHLKDTVITKTISDGFFSYNLWHTIIAVVIGSILTLLGVYLSNRHQKLLVEKQIQHQKNINDSQTQVQLKVKQAEIDVATKRKFIDDMISVSKELIRIYYTFVDLISDFQAAKLMYNLRFARMKYIEEHPETDGQEKLRAIEHLNEKSNLVKLIDDQLFQLSKEFYNHTTQTYLYMNKDNKEYEELKKINENIENSFHKYRNCFSRFPGDENTPTIDVKKYEDTFYLDYVRLKEKIQYLIDVERKNIDNMLINKSDIETPS